MCVRTKSTLKTMANTTQTFMLQHAESCIFISHEYHIFFFLFQFNGMGTPFQRVQLSRQIFGLFPWTQKHSRTQKHLTQQGSLAQMGNAQDITK